MSAPPARVPPDAGAWEQASRLQSWAPACQAQAKHCGSKPCARPACRALEAAREASEAAEVADSFKGSMRDLSGGLQPKHSMGGMHGPQDSCQYSVGPKDSQDLDAAL